MSRFFISPSQLKKAQSLATKHGVTAPVFGISITQQEDLLTEIGGKIQATATEEEIKELDWLYMIVLNISQEVFDTETIAVVGDLNNVPN